jgi:hypothetical protein
MTLNKPKNAWALCLYLLMENGNRGVTMVTAMKDNFHKFQTRLLELEEGRKHKLKIQRLPMTKKNRFGHTCTYTNYKSLAPKKYLINLYNKVNEVGAQKSPKK